MAFHIIAPDFEFDWPNCDLTLRGQLMFDPEQHRLMINTVEGHVMLSLNFERYDIPTPSPDQIWLEGYAELSSVPEALEAAGIGVISQRITLPPFNTAVYLFELTLESAQSQPVPA